MANKATILKSSLERYKSAKGFNGEPFLVIRKTAIADHDNARKEALKIKERTGAKYVVLTTGDRLDAFRDSFGRVDIVTTGYYFSSLWRDSPSVTSYDSIDYIKTTGQKNWEKNSQTRQIIDYAISIGGAKRCGTDVCVKANFIGEADLSIKRNGNECVVTPDIHIEGGCDASPAIIKLYGDEVHIYIDNPMKTDYLYSVAVKYSSMIIAPIVLSGGMTYQYIPQYSNIFNTLEFPSSYDSYGGLYIFEQVISMMARAHMYKDGIFPQYAGVEFRREGISIKPCEADVTFPDIYYLGEAEKLSVNQYAEPEYHIAYCYYDELFYLGYDRYFDIEERTINGTSISFFTEYGYSCGEMTVSELTATLVKEKKHNDSIGSLKDKTDYVISKSVPVGYRHARLPIYPFFSDLIATTFGMNGVGYYVLHPKGEVHFLKDGESVVSPVSHGLIKKGMRIGFSADDEPRRYPVTLSYKRGYVYGKKYVHKNVPATIENSGYFFDRYSNIFNVNAINMRYSSNVVF